MDCADGARKAAMRFSSGEPLVQAASGLNSPTRMSLTV
jgi:hypothetical protein